MSDDVPWVRTVSIYHAKTHLSQLVAEVRETGRNVTITRHDRPVARIVPVTSEALTRPIGLLQGEIVISEDLDAFSAEDERDWYGA
jgi:prevent-host-death family protein